MNPQLRNARIAGLYYLLVALFGGFAFVAIFNAITCLNLISQYGALIVATEPAYATLGPGGAAPVVLLLLDLQHAGYLVAQIFFGIWLWPLGTLILRSGLLPRMLAYFLRAAAIAYIVDVAAQFLAPAAVSSISEIAVVPVALLGEVSVLGYLLIRGIRKPEAGRSGAEQPLVSA